MRLRVLAVAVVLAGCSDGGEAPRQGISDTTVTSTVVEPYVLVISPAATELAETVGVDLERAPGAAADDVFDVLAHQDFIRIDVTVDGTRTIPSIGVGGYTATGIGNVQIWLDDTPPIPLVEVFDVWLPLAIAHELHNSSRMRVGPGYERALGDALVSEGLADSFAHELFPATTAPWIDALSPGARAEIWTAMEPHLWTPYVFDDHEQWFFGAGDLPNWAGYTIGFDAVQRYLAAAPGRTAAGSVDVPSEDILEGYSP